MAVTVHYCTKDSQRHLAIRARLGALRYIAGEHSGANLARHFIAILDELGILHKVHCFVRVYTLHDVNSVCTTDWLHYDGQRFKL